MRKILLALLVLFGLISISACSLEDFLNRPGAHTHSFTNYVSNNDATCTANGTETAKCDGCDETNTREVADSKVASLLPT